MRALAQDVHCCHSCLVDMSSRQAVQYYKVSECARRRIPRDAWLIAATIVEVDAVACRDWVVRDGESWRPLHFDLCLRDDTDLTKVLGGVRNETYDHC